LPAEVLCARLALRQPGGGASEWVLLTDGALPAACDAVAESVDAHFKFHAVSSLTVALERVKHALEVRLPPDGRCPETMRS
jgi:hypothetical protein